MSNPPVQLKALEGKTIKTWTETKGPPAKITVEFTDGTALIRLGNLITDLLDEKGFGLSLEVTEVQP